MPDVQINQSNQPPVQPPQQPPPQQPPPVSGDSSTAIWPILIVVLLLVLALLWFIFAREDATPETADRTDVEVNVPAADAPQVDVPDQINVELPDQVDVNIGTGSEPEGKATQTAPPPAEPPGG